MNCITTSRDESNNPFNSVFIKIFGRCLLGIARLRKMNDRFDHVILEK